MTINNSLTALATNGITSVELHQEAVRRFVALPHIYQEGEELKIDYIRINRIEVLELINDFRTATTFNVLKIVNNFAHLQDVVSTVIQMTNDHESSELEGMELVNSLANLQFLYQSLAFRLSFEFNMIEKLVNGMETADGNVIRFNDITLEETPEVTAILDSFNMMFHITRSLIEGIKSRLQASFSADWMEEASEYSLVEEPVMN